MYWIIFICFVCFFYLVVGLLVHNIITINILKEPSGHSPREEVLEGLGTEFVALLVWPKYLLVWLVTTKLEQVTRPRLGQYQLIQCSLIFFLLFGLVVPLVMMFGTKQWNIWEALFFYWGVGMITVLFPIVQALRPSKYSPFGTFEIIIFVVLFVIFGGLLSPIMLYLLKDATSAQHSMHPKS